MWFVKDERVALMRRGERRSSLFQSTLIQQQQQQQQRSAAVAGCGGDGNPHILISDASSLYSVEEIQDELSWTLRRPSTQSVGAVIVAVCQLLSSHTPPCQGSIGVGDGGDKCPNFT